MDIICAWGNLELKFELAEELKSGPGQFHYKKVDIANEAEVLELFAWIEENQKKVDVLVNNAGVFNFATLTDGKLEEWKVVIDTVVTGYSIVTREAVKFMKKHQIGDGLIINIQSVCAKVMLPMGAYMYTACEHALDALGFGLRQELQQQQLPIRVSKINPSLIKTEKVASNPAYNQMPAVEMQDIADCVMYLLQAPKHVEISDITLRPINSPF
ncbi:Dehydrogenase/reductase SDR member 11 [Homalodisca vitripennis]|nr:Dehydrogenase/reductase SDR member 11 [Homalodisca vitripennis]